MKTQVQKGEVTCPRPSAFWGAELRFEPSVLERVGFLHCVVNERAQGSHFSFGAPGRNWKPEGGRRQSSHKKEGKRNDAESGLWSV